MKKFVTKSKLSGEISVPASKSVLQRYILGAYLSNSETNIHNLNYCTDVETALGIISSLGCKHKKTNNTLSIKPSKKIQSFFINCKESAFCFRSFVPVVSLLPNKFTLQREKTLQRRPHLIDLAALKNLNVDIKFKDNSIVEIKGPMKAARVQLDASKTSQFLSGLLFAAANLENETIIECSDITSVPYLNLTLDVLKKFSVNVYSEKNKYIVEGMQEYIADDLYAEGDWSLAAYIMVAAAINGKVKLKNLDVNSKQGDRQILEILDSCGAKIKIHDANIEIENNTLNGFNWDFKNTPDLFPPVLGLAMACEGKSCFSGLENLRYKESDRFEKLIKQLVLMGAKIDFSNNTCMVQKSQLHGGEFKTNKDHRLAMLTGILALISENEIKVDEYTCVMKSYPYYFDDYAKIGGSIHE